MATFGTGNFGSDSAQEFLADLCDDLIGKVEAVMQKPNSLEAGEYWAEVVPGIVELLLLFDSRNLWGSGLPSVEAAERWKVTFLTAWDKRKHLFEDPEFASARRRKLTSTFSKLIRRAAAAN